ncbi:lipid-A-disaccharide synthase [bacterium]|nr:lipid-A-disaccharide synthase [bacterium]
MAENILIVAGEPSGDNIAGPLVECVKEIKPRIEFWGFGGKAMALRGVEILCDVSELAFMGFAEVIRHLPSSYRRLNELQREAIERKPKGAILIDYPGFNLKLAEKLAKQGIPVVFFVSPQIWAWKYNRIHKIKKYVSKMITILPFEAEIYRKEGIPVNYVGHPFVDMIKPTVKSIEFKQRYGIDGKLLLLLPGSRAQEVSRLIGPMLGAYQILSRENTSLKAIVARSSNVDIKLYDSAIAREGVTVATDIAMDAMFSADSAISCSGSATLQCMCAKLPHVITYKTNYLSASIYRSVVKTDYIGLTNLVAGYSVVPEVLLGDTTPANLAAAVRPWIFDGEANSSKRQELESIRAKLGETGVFSRAAKEIVSTLFSE